MIASADVFLDTNILLYAALGRHSNPRKFEIARRIVCAEDYCTSAQVLSEFYINAVGKAEHPLSSEEAAEWIRVVARKPCQPLDPALVRKAIDVAQNFALAYWDATIIAAAEQLGAKTLYSEDLHHGQTFGSVTAIDPFHDC